MRSMSDIIESYLKEIIAQQKTGPIEIKRNEVAEKFQCVPSQINYVIKTRFTIERGYAVESKRGGGGYIRIFRVREDSEAALIEQVLLAVEEEISYTMAEDLIHRLYEEQVLSLREAKFILAAIDRTIIRSPLPNSDQLRAAILQSMLVTLLYNQAE